MNEFDAKLAALTAEQSKELASVMNKAYDKQLSTDDAELEEKFDDQKKEPNKK